MTCKAWRFGRAAKTDTAPAPQTRRQERCASASCGRERGVARATPGGASDPPKNPRAARFLCRLARSAAISRDGSTDGSHVDDRPGSVRAGGARADGQEICVARPVGVPAPAGRALQDLAEGGRGLLASQQRRSAVGERSTGRSGFAAAGSSAGATADRQATLATERREAPRPLRPLERRAAGATCRTNVTPCRTGDRESAAGGGR
jgi:hypothetical protein